MILKRSWAFQRLYRLWLERRIGVIIVQCTAEFSYMLSLHPRCSMREIKKSFNDKAYKTKLTLILKYIIATLYLITTTLHYYVIVTSYDVKVSETQSVLIYFQIAIKLQRNVRLSKFKLIYILKILYFHRSRFASFLR